MPRAPLLYRPGLTFGDPFLTLHREMNRLFDDVLRATPDEDGGRTNALTPHLDVSENENELRLQAELPGVDERDIELGLEDDVLTIRAEKRSERRLDRGESHHVTERVFGMFQRSLRLPFHADPRQVRADFARGVLTVTVPKTQAQQRAHKIPVQGQTTAGGAAASLGQHSADAAHGGNPPPHGHPPAVSTGAAPVPETGQSTSSQSGQGLTGAATRTGAPG